MGDHDGSIPYQRFNEVVEEKNSWKTKFEQLNEKLQKVESVHSKTIKQLEEEANGWKAKYEGQAVQFEVDKTLMKHNIDDDEVIEYVRYRYDAHQPTEGEKPSFGDWFKDYAEKKPAVLRPFLERGQEVKAEPKAKPEPKAKTEASTEAKRMEDPGSRGGGQSGTLTPADIAKLDAKQFNDLLPELLKNVT